jgi:3-oxoacyl-[acyl-carrier-protein] synthase-3
VDYEDRSTAVLFGDAAGAVIVEAHDEDGFLSAELGSDGTHPEMLWIPAGGSRTPIDSSGLAERENKIHMSGREVFKFAVYKMIESLDIALRKAGLQQSDVALLIPHQANRRIIDAAAERLELPPERVVVNVHEYGNTSAATIPVALSETEAAGRLHKGDVIAFVGMGGGLSWGALLWRWDGVSSRNGVHS